MGRTHTARASGAVTAALSFCLIANLAPLMTFPAVLPEASRAWGLDVTQAGWVGGIFFAGYAVAVPFLSAATDRMDSRWVLGASTLLAAAAGLGLALVTEGFWSALIFRLLGGVALAGVHMPGLKLLSERVDSRLLDRSAAVYTSSYAVGSAGSFLLAGVVDAMLGWQATFLVSGCFPLLAFPMILPIRPAPLQRVAPGPMLDFGSVLRDRRFMTYVFGFAGNTWEVFGIRVWFVACLSWSLGLPGNDLELPNLAIVGGLAALAGVPASVWVAEMGARWGRALVIVAVCVVSLGVCLALALAVGSGIAVVLTLLVLLQITSFADVGALSSGAVAFSSPERRGAALAVYSFAGFTTGFLGPVAVGFALDAFGGADSETGWRAAFLTLAAGAVVALWAALAARRAERGARLSDFAD